ncbi:MAG TPA: hypothetical protein VGD58_32230 [Herpetosiphonaceae bacterium]
MSDRPLFQNSDEQEAIYAPQQLPADTRAKETANVDDAREREVGDDVVIVPAASAGMLGQTGGGISTGVVGGAPSAIGPAVGEDAVEDVTDENRRDRRD